nr:DUF29 domain-containing protein [uncultured Rhodopila sp.]
MPNRPIGREVAQLYRIGKIADAQRIAAGGIMSDLYDVDVLLWSRHQADLLRRRAAGEPINEAELDWPNIAEEIDSLGKTVARELSNRILTILIHLMKLAASPAIEPRIGWLETIREQRERIEGLLKDAPSLRPTVPAITGEKLPAARKRVRAALADYGEQPRADIDGLVFTGDQVLEDWFPRQPG